MDKNYNDQHIGIMNGAVLCVDDSMSYGLLSGNLYHAYHKDAIPVESIDELMMVLRALFDRINFPHSSTTMRSFLPEDKKSAEGEKPLENKSLERVLTEQELLQKHGDMATFIIRVQQRQNSTWQGRVTWREENKTKRFNSTWELVQLLELTISGRESIDEIRSGRSWDM